MTKEVAVGLVAALIAAAAAIVAARMQADATILGARIQADGARPAPTQPEPRAGEVPFPAVTPPAPSKPQVSQSTSPSPLSNTEAFEGFVRGPAPETVGKLRLEIQEDEQSGRVAVRAFWFAGVEGSASLTGIRNVRGELNAQGSALLESKQVDCRLSATFTNERRIEGEYTIIDHGDPSKVERRRFSALRL